MPYICNNYDNVYPSASILLKKCDRNFMWRMPPYQFAYIGPNHYQPVSMPTVNWKEDSKHQSAVRLSWQLRPFTRRGKAGGHASFPPLIHRIIGLSECKKWEKGRFSISSFIPFECLYLCTEHIKFSNFLHSMVPSFFPWSSFSRSGLPQVIHNWILVISFRYLKTREIDFLLFFIYINIANYTLVHENTV